MIDIFALEVGDLNLKIWTQLIYNRLYGTIDGKPFD